MIQFTKKLLGIQHPSDIIRIEHLNPAQTGPDVSQTDQQALVQSLLDKADRYEEEQQRLITRLERHNHILKETLKAAGGYIWRKDAENKYVWCDPSFCKNFFALSDVDCTYEIEGTPEHVLFDHFESKTGMKNHFEKVCRITDQHCLKQREKSRYIEIGYVGDCLTVLDVTKTPLLRMSDDKGGIVGFAIDRTEHAEAIKQMIRAGAKDGYITRVAKSPGAKAYWIQAPDGECAELFESMTITADYFK